MLKTKIISSMEKPFTDACLDQYEELKYGSALLGETYSFQLIYTYEMEEELGSEIAFNVCARSVKTMTNIRERINGMIKAVAEET